MFKIKGNEYEPEKIEALRLVHVARRLSPLIGGIGAALQTVSIDKDGGVTVNDPFGSYMPIAKVMSEMKEADFDYVRDAALGACKRIVSPGVRSPIFVGGRMQYEDIEFTDIITIIWNVLDFNRVFAFFPASQGSQTSAAPAQ